jgi:putative membrane-bound dehydrogenase-like protein
MRVEEGLRVELVAAEPLVIDPVAFAFDAAGGLYVAEGRAYPDPVEQGSGASTLGRIARLEDEDGDGRYERRTEFAAGLGYVNGILPWRGGFFVTAAPDILYLKDTDGDGLADERRVVLTGFDATKTAQLRVSHPTLGLDGKVYVTSGLNGGRVISPLHPERAPVVFSSRDGRFDPDTLVFENTGGRGQYGLVIDEFGRRFETTNRHPVLQVMLEPWHLARNPHLAFSETTQEVSKVEAEAKVWPISRATIAADFVPKLMGAPHTGTFTSACGMLLFGGTALTPAHVGNLFICEPAQNLVQRQVLRPAGASFASEPAERGKEFLASNDVWFRPVFLGGGPDGALYVADMNRREIDHPRYIPAESRGLLDFESGKDRGRIYRVARADAPRLRRAASLASGETAASLVQQLDSPDAWWRAHAFRLLLEREPVHVATVAQIATESPRSESRSLALWLLRRWQRLESTHLSAALRDRHSAVREQALQLAGERVNEQPALAPHVLAGSRDDDARVRFVAALVLGSMTDPRGIDALAEIAARDGEDRWTRAAVLSGIAGRLDAFHAAFRRQTAAHAPAVARVMEDLGRLFGAAASPDACRRFLQPLLTMEANVPWGFSAALGLIEGFRARGGKAQDSLAAVLGEGAEAQAAFFAAAANVAADSRAPLSERSNAVALLAFTNFATAGERLAALLDPREPAALQIQVIRALERVGDARGAALLVQREMWTRYTPQVREAAIAALTGKPAFVRVLFDAIRAGVVAAPEVSSTRRAQLLKHADPAVKQDAAEIFKHLEGGDRMAIYRTLRDALDPKADPALGKAVFVRACSACHTHRGEGGKVGPDLTGVRNQPADALLLHIFVPNYEVTPAYQSLTVTTRDGRAVTGWLTAETENSLALRTAFGSEETVLRKDIAATTASGVSLMPDGLEQTMTKAEVSALIAFLKTE